MGQNFNKNTYHATGQAAYLDLEAAKNNFDALASSFCGPQNPAALGFSEPGMLWLNNSTGILSQRNESNSARVTLFDLRNSRIAAGRVTAVSIANGARKPSLINGQAITPASCSVHTAFESELTQITADYADGDIQLIESSGTATISNTRSAQRLCGVRLGRWGGTLRITMNLTRSTYYSWVECVLRRNGTTLGSVLTVADAHATGTLTQTISANQPGDLLEAWVDKDSLEEDIGGSIQLSASMSDAPLVT
jgi:hypothetical protein